MKVKELLTGPEKWVKYVYAVDATGASVEPIDPRATAFCLRGAIRHCYPSPEQHKPIERMAYSSIQAFVCLVEWNDAPERTFADVRKLIEELDI